MNLPHQHDNNSVAVMHNLPAFSAFEETAFVLKMLGDANRIRIFWILCQTKECLINLSAMIDMSSPAISHHLKKLKECDLITSTRHGKEMYYTVANTPQAKLLEQTIADMMALTKGEKQ